MIKSRKHLVATLIAGFIASLVGPHVAWPGSDDPGSADAGFQTMIGNEAGQTRDDNGLKMKLVWCPPGFVTMAQVEGVVELAVETDGMEDDSADQSERRLAERIKPVKVFVSRGYWIGKFEVTQSEWRRLMHTMPWWGDDNTRAGDDFPATWVAWEDAMDFCRKLTEHERKANRLPDGWQYTLPTEAQWERACRARTETRFSFGDDEEELDVHGWFRGNAFLVAKPHPRQVGRKKPNPWGLFDMHGNVSELCRDGYSQTLPGGRDPEVADVRKKLADRVMRGGHYVCRAAECASGHRAPVNPTLCSSFLGFRVALTSVTPDGRLSE